MLRLLIIVGLVLGLAMWFLKGRRNGAPPPPGGGGAGKPAAESAPMVACAHCGVHLPRPEASFDVEGRSYCSDAHRLAGPK